MITAAADENPAVTGTDTNSMMKPKNLNIYFLSLQEIEEENGLIRIAYLNEESHIRVPLLRIKSREVLRNEDSYREYN